MLTSILVPIFVCVVLPVSIIWIIFYTNRKKNDNVTQIILESIKNNPGLNTEKLISSFENSRKKKVTPWQNLNRKLLRGSIFTLMGIAFAFLGAFGGDEDIIFGSWFFCGMLSAIGIGFLITYWFAYKNINRQEAEYNSRKAND